MSSILSLPDGVLRDILVLWLKVQDVGRLDMAFCTTELRGQFCEVAYACGSVYSTPEWLFRPTRLVNTGSCNLYILWALTRDVSVSGLFVTNLFESNRVKRIQYLQNHGKYVRKVLYAPDCASSPGWEDALSDLCQYCPNVKNLHCSRSFHTAAYEQLARAWPHLTSIVLGTNVKDECMEHLGKSCRKLTKISANFAFDLTAGGWLKLLKHPLPLLQSIKTCQQDRVVFTKDVYRAIAAQCPSMRCLDLDYRELNDDLLVTLAAGCTQVEELNLETNQRVTDRGIAAFAASGRLTRLEIRENAHVGDASLVQVAQHCRGLVELCIDGCCRVTNATLVEVGRYCPNLVHLRVECIPKVGDEGLVAVAQGCPLLVELAVSETSAGDSGLIAIAQHCSHLEMVVLAQTKVTDAAIQALAAGCARLTTLDVSSCLGVANAALRALAVHSLHLTNLTISDTSVSLPGVRLIARSCTQLREIELDEKVLSCAEDADTLFDPNVSVALC